MLTVGDTLPDFHLIGVYGKQEESFTSLTEKSFENKWKILFFWPKDFTFICPTEIVGYGNINEELQNRNAILIGCSTDTEFVHAAWRRYNEDLSDSPFVWLSDEKKELCNALGIIAKNTGVSLRATFIIDPKNIIRNVQVNDLTVGRNPQETLRILDALQTDGLCPCEWKKGDSTL